MTHDPHRWSPFGLNGPHWDCLRRRRRPTYATAKCLQARIRGLVVHVLLPFAAYAMLVASAYQTQAHAHAALFVVGAAALLLLFIGIHNAWDTVTHLVFVKNRERQETERDQ